MNYAVQCEGAFKEFQKKGKGFKLFKSEKLVAINDVSFDVKKGNVFGIIGPNGSGKSTIIRMLSTLLLPDRGKLSVFGMDVTKKIIDVQKLINRVSVDASFFKKLSVSENLSFASRLYGISPKDGLEKATQMLLEFGLEEEKITQPVEDLSRGQQQMVSIARSLISDPNLLLLDEPTTGLDPHSKMKVQDFVKKVMKSSDTTVILTSHDMNEVEKLCNSIAFIKDGKIWGQGSAEELKQKAGRKSLEEVFLHLTGVKFDKDELGS